MGAARVLEGAMNLRPGQRVPVCKVRWRMTISFARHQFPRAIIRHAVWLYGRFTLSYRDAEDLLAERWLDASYDQLVQHEVRALRPFDLDHAV
jgi:hypothetical protein